MSLINYTPHTYELRMCFFRHLLWTSFVTENVQKDKDLEQVTQQIITDHPIILQWPFLSDRNLLEFSINTTHMLLKYTNI